MQTYIPLLVSSEFCLFSKLLSTAVACTPLSLCFNCLHSEQAGRDFCSCSGFYSGLQPPETSPLLQPHLRPQPKSPCSCSRNCCCYCYCYCTHPSCCSWLWPRAGPPI